MLAHGLHARAHGLPQFTQVIHGPDRVAECVEAGNAGAGLAFVVERRDLGRSVVVFGHGDHGLQGVVQPLGGILVARGGPFFGPAFHRKHETQRPDLGKSRQVLFLESGLLVGRHVGHRAAHVHHLGVVTGIVFQRLDLGVQRRCHLVPALGPQGHEAGLLRLTCERAAFCIRCFASSRRCQQHREVFVGGDWPARADHRGHETFAKLPLRRFIMAGAQVVEDVVQLVKGFHFHPAAVGR